MPKKTPPHCFKSIPTTNYFLSLFTEKAIFEKAYICSARKTEIDSPPFHLLDITRHISSGTFVPWKQMCSIWSIATAKRRAGYHFHLLAYIIRKISLLGFLSLHEKCLFIFTRCMELFLFLKTWRLSTFFLMFFFAYNCGALAFLYFYWLETFLVTQSVLNRVKVRLTVNIYQPKKKRSRWGLQWEYELRKGNMNEIRLMKK